MRTVHPNHFGPAVPPSATVSVSTAAMPSRDFSVGPSVWVLSKLPLGIVTLEQCKPALRDHGIVVMTAGQLHQMGIDAFYTPNDAKPPFESCRDAHASLFNLDTAKRDALVMKFSEHIDRLPNPVP